MCASIASILGVTEWIISNTSGWKFETLAFSGKNAKSMKNILNSRWKGEQGEDGQMEWYDWILEEIRRLADLTLELTFDCYETGADKDTIEFESTALGLLGIEDHFDCESGLNREGYDGFWTYVRVIDPVKEAERISDELDYLRISTDEKWINVMEHWGHDLIKLQSFLEELDSYEESPVVQLLTIL
jgi:hypothetical protein